VGSFHDDNGYDMYGMWNAQNIMTAVNVLCQQAEERKIRLGSKAEAAKDRLTNLTAERGDEKLTAEMAGLVKTLWTDKGIRK
jgi:hypothetical protein